MKYLVFLCVLMVSLLLVAPVEAKVLPQAKSAPKVVQKSTGSGSITIYPRLRRDRKALLVTFSNLQNTSSVSYTLVYETNGQQEGAGGSVKPTEGTANRELLFGTCSSGVCRYHSGIKNMKFEVTTVLKNGKTSIKRYKIRV